MHHFLTSWDEEAAAATEACAKAVADAVKSVKGLRDPSKRLFTTVQPCGSFLVRTGVKKQYPGAREPQEFDLVATMDPEECTMSDIESGLYLDIRARVVTKAFKNFRKAFLGGGEADTVIVPTRGRKASAAPRGGIKGDPPHADADVAPWAAQCSAVRVEPFTDVRCLSHAKGIIAVYYTAHGEKDPCVRVVVYVKPHACPGEIGSAKALQRKSPLYSALVAEDHYMFAYTAALHAACSASAEFTHAVILAKAWARGEGIVADYFATPTTAIVSAPADTATAHNAGSDASSFSAGTGVNGFVITVMMLHLLRSGGVPADAPAELILRRFWVAVAQGTFEVAPDVVLGVAVPSSLPSAATNSHVPALKCVLSSICHLNVFYRLSLSGAAPFAAEALRSAAQRALTVTAGLTSGAEIAAQEQGATARSDPYLERLGRVLPVMARYDACIEGRLHVAPPPQPNAPSPSPKQPAATDIADRLATKVLAAAAATSDGAEHEDAAPSASSILTATLAAVNRNRRASHALTAAYGRGRVTCIVVHCAVPTTPPTDGATHHNDSSVVVASIPYSAAITFSSVAEAKSRLFRGPPLDDRVGIEQFDALWSPEAASTRQFADSGVFRCVLWPAGSGVDATPTDSGLDALVSAGAATSTNGAQRTPVAATADVTRLSERSAWGGVDCGHTASIVRHLLQHHLSGDDHAVRGTADGAVTIYGADVTDVLKEASGTNVATAWFDYGAVATSACLATYESIRSWLYEVCEAALPGKISAIQHISAGLRGLAVFPERPQLTLLRASMYATPDSVKRASDGPSAFTAPQILQACCQVGGTDAATTPLVSVLTLDDKGKVPDNLEAIQAMRAALLGHIATALTESAESSRHKAKAAARRASPAAGATAQLSALTPVEAAASACAVFVSAQHLDVCCRGFVFRFLVGHFREVSLLKSLGRDEEAAALTRKLYWSQRHAAYMEGVTKRHGAAATAIRLAKRWVDAMHLSDFVTDEAVELLTAFALRRDEDHVVGSATKRNDQINAALDGSLPSSDTLLAATTPHVLLAHFWEVLAYFPFEERPLVIETTDAAAAAAAFGQMRTDAARRMSDHGGPPAAVAQTNLAVALFIAAPYAPSESPFTQGTPRRIIVERLRDCAASALRLVALKRPPMPSCYFLDPRAAFDLVVGSAAGAGRRDAELLWAASMAASSSPHRAPRGGAEHNNPNDVPRTVSCAPVSHRSVLPRPTSVMEAMAGASAVASTKAAGALTGSVVAQLTTRGGSASLSTNGNGAAVREIRRRESATGLVLRDAHDSPIGVVYLGGRRLATEDEYVHVGYEAARPNQWPATARTASEFRCLARSDVPLALVSLQALSTTAGAMERFVLPVVPLHKRVDAPRSVDVPARRSKPAIPNAKRQRPANRLESNDGDASAVAAGRGRRTERKGAPGPQPKGRRDAAPADRGPETTVDATGDVPSVAARRTRRRREPSTKATAATGAVHDAATATNPTITLSAPAPSRPRVNHAALAAL